MLVGHKKQWDFLKQKFESGQLSHTYLLSGQEGIGKKLFAQEFAKSINCKFPDLMVVESENKEIPIAKIREVQNFLSYKPYYGGYKIVIVDNAGNMNQEAQSCFLKTLEEPKERSLIFLVTSAPDSILPTIHSRCQQIKFLRPKNLPENEAKTAKEQEILKEILPVINSGFPEKFKYAKLIDPEARSIQEIICVLEKYFRNELKAKIGDREKTLKLAKILKMIGEINKKLIFTNSNQKLALELLLMEL